MGICAPPIGIICVSACRVLGNTSAVSTSPFITYFVFSMLFLRFETRATATGQRDAQDTKLPRFEPRQLADMEHRTDYVVPSPLDQERVYKYYQRERQHEHHTSIKKFPSVHISPLPVTGVSPQVGCDRQPGHPFLFRLEHRQEARLGVRSFGYIKTYFVMYVKADSGARVRLQRHQVRSNRRHRQRVVMHAHHRGAQHVVRNRLHDVLDEQSGPRTLASPAAATDRQVSDVPTLPRFAAERVLDLFLLQDR